MQNPEMRKKVMAGAALLLPVIIVKAASIFLGGASPATAHASAPAPASVDAANAAPAEAPKPPTAEELAAATYVQQLTQKPFGPTPLLFDTPQSTDPEVTVVIAPTPSTDTNASYTPLPKFTVGAVMSSSKGQRALINGRPYLQGEIIRGTTWFVAQINSDSRSVTLADQNSDRTVTINVELPW